MVSFEQRLLRRAQREERETATTTGDAQGNPPPLEGEVLRWMEGNIPHALNHQGIHGYGYTIPGTLSGPPRWHLKVELPGLVGALRARVEELTARDRESLTGRTPGELFSVLCAFGDSEHVDDTLTVGEVRLAVREFTERRASDTR